MSGEIFEKRTRITDERLFMSDIFWLLFRSLNKKEGILLMLQSVITTQHTVHPTFAAAEYFEFELRNPYNVEHTISIQWEERELGSVDLYSMF